MHPYQEKSPRESQEESNSDEQQSVGESFGGAPSPALLPPSWHQVLHPGKLIWVHVKDHSFSRMADEVPGSTNCPLNFL